MMDNEIHSLAGRRIVLGISGGIAAYKSAELVRLLVKAGAEVRVVMTHAATEFICPLTLQALSQHEVKTELFDLTQEATIGHIELADWAELLVIAPATADVLTRIALGFANDLLTTIALACKAPLVVAPAMNVNMWNHPATQENLAQLLKRGVEIVGPGDGELACGWVGSGRMSEPNEISDVCRQALGPCDLKGLKVLVTAGPTYEALDPVRYISNRSSGKMGFAIAQAAAWRGAKVVLISGPVNLNTPFGVDRIDIESAKEMQGAVLLHRNDCDMIIMAAAVADYRPQHQEANKIKKSDLGLQPIVQLERNPDILKDLGANSEGKKRPILVGFAAETQELEKYALEKLKAKNCDLLIGNNINEEGSAFGSNTNHVFIVTKEKKAGEWLPLMPKAQVAHEILNRAKTLLSDRR